ncbi:MAG: hypothetical protein Q9214_004132 [Letrouitia sp. 1 TL-2023]
MNPSLDYADNHVDQSLHPALSDSGITYSPNHDCFLDDSDHIDENALKEDQQAFADALQQYEDSAPPKLKTGIDLRRTHDWQEVITQVEKARAEYKGMGKPGILRSIHGGFRSFTTAAPAIQAWLKLLPSTSWYGSILCEKYIGSFCKGPAYATALQDKMKRVALASQAVDDQADISQHIRLQQIQKVSWQSNAPIRTTYSARNHLYAVFRDTEAWQEAVQSWAASAQAKKSRKLSQTLSTLEQQERDLEARKSLLEHLGHNHGNITEDVEAVLRQIARFRLVDQDRVLAITKHPKVEEWLVSPDSGALLVQAHCRRHDAISPASAASAMLVHILSSTMSFITLHWFCGLHISGPDSSASAMMQSFVCQLLSSPHLRSHPKCPRKLGEQDCRSLLKLFSNLIRQLPERTIVICAIDGVSYYEGVNQRRDICKSIRKIVNLTRTEPLVFKLFMTSPTRTSYVHQKPNIARHLTVVELPQHLGGGTQGFNHRAVTNSTERTARRLSERLKEL